jgi:hypothetical protein
MNLQQLQAIVAHETDNGNHLFPLPTLGKESAFIVRYDIERKKNNPRVFIFIINSKGNGCLLDEPLWDAVCKRREWLHQFQPGEIKDTGQYESQNWPECPNLIFSPYVAKLLDWALEPLLQRPPTANDFYRALDELFQEAAEQHRPYIDVISGDLHQLVGGYPNEGNHRMPVCCGCMRKKMQARDQILAQPPEGNGATLCIRYFFPRINQQDV